VLCDKVPSPAVYDLWTEALLADPRTRDFTVNEFQIAFAKIKSSFKPTAACQFPTPAHLFETIDEPTKSVDALIIEEAWNKAMDWTRKWYLGEDLGVDRRAPAMEEKQYRALMAAGGYEYVMSCTRVELQWAKKRFAEAYGHHVVLEKEGTLIGRGEAKKVLERLQTTHTPEPVNPALPAVPQTIPLEKIESNTTTTAPVPEKSFTPPLTEKQYQERVAFLKKQREDLLKPKVETVDAK